ncbi:MULTISPECIES: thiamine pyrophosphate-dependent enzyme [unclassified Beijerinckia]|uniref:thiamine pyrophosphate-dependent enzyme n=1 Tax=unclassified Beijerinckia TaxID=2638183 RepID=UPI00089D93DC|nr:MULTISPECIES: thiamine pyrophosphate-dependent enzyme [unclassified Beijerinckia]MDH7799213.1 sulfopyruvate decarboxylase subunit beta [Beijerinckia sp. GAS462]SED91794.1 sulfopyruvate decarboxylase subunit beta [Beijerinckia sp. 28-YEA-48]
MNRHDVLQIFARYREESPAVLGPSFGGRILYALAHRPATIYNMELGYPTAVCLGLALSLPQEPIYAVEGDGSMLAGLATLTTVARYAPPNLTILVIDNRAYVTTGSIPSATATGSDLAAIARGAGLTEVYSAHDTYELEQAFSARESRRGPFFIVAKIDQENMSEVGVSSAMPFDIVESSIRFRRTLEDKGLVPPIWAV